MGKQVLRGSEVMLFVNGETIALATSSTLELTTNTVDSRTKDSAYGAETEFDYVSWTANSESMVGATAEKTAQQTAADLIALQLAGTPVTIVQRVVARTSAAMDSEGWTTAEQTDKAYILATYTGEAWIKSVSVNNPNDGKSTLTVQFEGTGALTVETATT